MKRSSGLARLPRRELLSHGLRAFGALTFGAGFDLIAAGCAKVPASSTPTGQKLMHVRYQVAGVIEPVGSATPVYYFVVINLTNNPGDPGGPDPIVLPPYGNTVAAPPPTAPAGSQGFVGFIQYDSNSGNYAVYTCPVTGTGPTAAFVPATSVISPPPAGFTFLSLPDSYILPSTGSNTLDVTIDLNRLKPSSVQTLPAYVQVNIITYNSLPINSNQIRYWDAIGDGLTNANDYQTLSTAQSGQSITSQSGNITEPTGDVQTSSGQTVTSALFADVANMDLSFWSITIQ